MVEDGKRIDGRKTTEPAKSIIVLDEMILIEASCNRACQNIDEYPTFQVKSDN